MPPYVYPHNFPPADGDRQQAFFQGLEKAVGEMNADGLPTVLAAHLAVLGCDLTGHRRMQNDSIMLSFRRSAPHTIILHWDISTIPKRCAEATAGLLTAVRRLLWGLTSVISTEL